MGTRLYGIFSRNVRRRDDARPGVSSLRVAFAERDFYISETLSLHRTDLTVTASSIVIGVSAFVLSVAPTGLRAQGAGSLLHPDTTLESGNLVVQVWLRPHITVVGLPDTLVFLYLPRNEAPLDSIARRYNLRGLVNGSFFEGVRGNATHAGWLSMYGRTITPLMDDRQLTDIVRLNGTLGTVEVLPVRSFTPGGDSHCVEFQTGPLVIENGIIREDLIQKSINGSTRHTRTLLATIDRRRIFVVSVSDRVTLSELAATMLRFPVFQHGRLDVVNLDGGSSVALYLRDVARFNFNAGDTLPILLGFH